MGVRKRLHYKYYWRGDGERRRRRRVWRLGLGSRFLRLGAFHACHSYKAEGNNETVWGWIKKNYSGSLQGRAWENTRERKREGAAAVASQSRSGTPLISNYREMYISPASPIFPLCPRGEQDRKEEGSGEKMIWEGRTVNYLLSRQNIAACKHSISRLEVDLYVFDTHLIPFVST